MITIESKIQELKGVVYVMINWKATHPCCRLTVPGRLTGMGRNMIRIR